MGRDWLWNTMDWWVLHEFIVHVLQKEHGMPCQWDGDPDDQLLQVRIKTPKDTDFGPCVVFNTKGQ